MSTATAVVSCYTLPEYAAMLAAVRAAPDDDLPRLVAADWLDEHGEGERAEFVRVQCEYVNLFPHLNEHKAEAGCETCSRGYALSDLLTGRFKVPSNAPLPFADDCPHRLCQMEGRTGPRVEWDWHRGFVAEVRCTQNDWCGGVCEKCRDDWQGIHPFQRPNRCEHCKGIGPEVVRYHPVERVVLTDNAARMIPSRGERGDFVAYTRPVPQEVMDIINRSRLRRLQNVEDATSALSAALIAWAKSQPAPVVTSV